jgi:hypothetical protein
MLIIFARDRVLSNTFSFKATLRSWKQGFVSLVGQFIAGFRNFQATMLFSLDALIGLPAVHSNGIDLQVESERSKFLVIELSPHVNTAKRLLLKTLPVLHRFRKANGKCMKHSVHSCLYY